MKKVLYLVDHAPHYREHFYRGIGKKCNLTIAGKPCSEHGLLDPPERLNYEYIEMKRNPFFWKFGINYIPEEWSLLAKKDWDIVIVCWDLHYILRIPAFLFLRNKTTKWFWAGHFFGKSKSSLMIKLRRFFINRSDGAITNIDQYAKRLVEQGVNVPVYAFQNSEVLVDDCQLLDFDFIPGKIKLLHVGKYQKRKNVDRLIDLAIRNPKVEVRIIGTGMIENFNKNNELSKHKNIQIYDGIIGDALKPHMQWSDIVVCPGAVGLLVHNAGKHGRGIITDSLSDHGPEHYVAKEANQPFIDFTNIAEVENTLQDYIDNRQKLIDLGHTLHNHVKSNYTIENMINNFSKALEL